LEYAKGLIISTYPTYEDCGSDSSVGHLLACMTAQTNTVRNQTEIDQEKEDAEMLTTINIDTAEETMTTGLNR
jgi:hypothetical protein